MTSENEVKKISQKSEAFEIAENEVLGRYLIASRDLKPGEIILQESPLIIGPNMDSLPLCLECYQSFKVQKWKVCPRCKLVPVCKTGCRNLTGGHSMIECLAFSQMKSKLTTADILNNLQVFMPLRCIFLTETDPEKWEKLVHLESHVDQRRDTLVWKLQNENILKVLKDWDFIPPDITDDIMQKVCGILDVNTFELRVPRYGDLGDIQIKGEDCVRGLYLNASLMAHDCIGNTHIAVDDNFIMTIRSNVPIRKGEKIYFNYTNTLQGTFERQQHLREGKYFDCKCNRCSDPKELQTNMSSLLCPKCKTGLVSPDHNSNFNRYLLKSQWECEKCQHKFSGAMVHTTIEQARDILEKLDKNNYKESELVLKKLSLNFPQSHFLILELKQSLIGMYRDVLRRDPKPTKYVLSRKYDLCRELLPILEVIEPGISRLRGITLYEMHIPLVVLSNREYESGEIKADKLLDRLLEAEEIVREAIKLLLFEPKFSPEGRLVKQAMEELKMLTSSIGSVKEIVRLSSLQGLKDKSKRQNKKKSNKRRR